MSVQNYDGPIFLTVFLLPLLSALLALCFYKPYLRVGFLPAWGLAVLAMVAGFLTAMFVLQNTTLHAVRWDFIPVPREVSLGSYFLPIFLLPLAVKLYGAWILGKMTEAEQRTGSEGLRAWLGMGNLVCVVGVALCGWLGFGYSFWALLVLGLGLVVAYPMIRSAGAAEPASETGSGSETPSERERVLRMLEEGKIQADEAAELLSALGEPGLGAGAPGRPAVTWSGKQKLILIGAILVFAGFLFPWFTVNVSDELVRATKQLPVPIQNLELFSQVLPGGGSTNMVVKVSGSDVDYGLGWIALGLAVAVAGLNLVPNQLTASTRGLVTKLCLAAGGALLAYLVLDNLRYVSVGLLVVVVGYGMLVAGSWVSGARARVPVRVEA